MRTTAPQVTPRDNTDMCFGTQPEDKVERQHSSYVTKIKQDLPKAYQLAEEASNKLHVRNKKAYDKRVSC